jgi:hypothetical protein
MTKSAAAGRPAFVGVHWEKSAKADSESMPINRHYDTVAFDVRESTTMLFFARTTPTGDIDDYLLLMRTAGEDADESLYLEINERQFGGNDLIREAHLTGNVLTLKLAEPLAGLERVTEIVLTYDDTAANKANVEAGAFRVLGNTLCGGNA